MMASFEVEKLVSHMSASARSSGVKPNGGRRLLIEAESMFGFFTKMFRYLIFSIFIVKVAFYEPTYFYIIKKVE